MTEFADPSPESQARGDGAAPAAGDASKAVAPTRRGRPWGRFAAVVLLVALDLWSKSAVFEWLGHDGQPGLPAGAERWELGGHVRYEVWGDFLGFLLSENKGAAWGVGDQYPYLLVGGRILAVLVIGWLLWRSPRRPRIGLWALVLVEAGALGNLYDNLTRTPTDGHPFGAVRDFIHVYFAQWDYHFPTFNVADSCITCGAVLLIASGFLPVSKDAAARAPSAPAG